MHIPTEGKTLEKIKADLELLRDGNNRILDISYDVMFGAENKLLDRALSLIGEWQAAGKKTVTGKTPVDIVDGSHVHVGADIAYQLAHMPDTYTLS